MKALKQANSTCVLPFGILEKHGPSGPIGTDLIDVRYITTKAVQKEYALVFPDYYVGQIFEARHQPGTIAYSSQLQLQMLAGNGFRNGPQRMPEDFDRRRPWREHQFAELLFADSVGFAQGLRGVRV